MRILTPAERRLGLGATDVAAIVGVSSYRAPIDVYLEKRGELDPPESSWRMRMGQLLEPSIAAAYSEQTGRRLAKMGVVFDRERPYFYAHPDRRIVGERGLVEIKATEHSRDYDDGVPPAVRVQVAWQMGLTARDFVDVAVLAGTTSGFQAITVERDDELIDELREEADRFWRENVQAGVPPEVDGSPAYRDYLRRLYPRDSGAEIVATPELILVFHELRDAERLSKLNDGRVELLKNRIRAAMGEASRMLAPGAVATYRRESPRTPWEAIAKTLANDAGVELDGIVDAAKGALEGSRVLRITWKGEAE